MLLRFRGRLCFTKLKGVEGQSEAKGSTTAEFSWAEEVPKEPTRLDKLKRDFEVREKRAKRSEERTAKVSAEFAWAEEVPKEPTRLNKLK